MAKFRFAEGLKVLPILAVQDAVATAKQSSYIDLDQVNWASFLVSFGAITSTDSTGEVVVTVEASTAGSSNATEAAIAFNYRLSAAIDTDTMGAITAATASGVAVGQASDNVDLIIDVDPAAVAAGAADRRYLRVVLTPTSDIAASLMGVTAILEPRYPGNSLPSST